MRNDFICRLDLRTLSRRRGSVLILVVVMVVLLALLGTALLSTSRGDRFTSTQHVVNTQIDLLVEGVKQLAIAKITNSLTGDSNAGAAGTIGGPIAGYRPPMDTKAAVGTTSYANYSAFETNDDPSNAMATNIVNGYPWLSQRQPMIGQFTDPSTGAPTNLVYWPNVTQWLTGSGFESPVVWSDNGSISFSVSPQFSFFRSDPGHTAAVTNYPFGLFAPTSKTIDGTSFPAFRFVNSANVGTTFLAGDADGDGIADSPLMRLPVGTIDGVTYYAAVKIVDLNSTVNINTAGSRTFDSLPGSTAGGGTLCDALATPETANFAGNLGAFQSHLGLEELLHNSSLAGMNQNTTSTTLADWQGNKNGQAELLALNRFRYGYDTSATAGLYASGTMILESGGTYNTSYDVDNGAAGTFSTQQPYNAALFLTAGDALQHQLAQRLVNPGYDQLSSAGYAQYRAFSLGDEAALAYHGGLLLNYNAGLSSAESTFYTARTLDATIPGTFADSIYSSAPNYQKPATGSIPSGPLAGHSAYRPSQVGMWYDENFNNDGTTVFVNGDTTSPLTDNTTYRPIRSLISTWSPTSNLIQPRKLPDAVSTTGLQAPTGYTADTFPTTYNLTAAKTCINTATFDELWLAFWNVMAEQQTGAGTLTSSSPFDGGAVTFTAPLHGGTGQDEDEQTGNVDNIYTGENFNNDADLVDPPGDGVSFPMHHERMFRSSIRDPHDNSAGPNPVFFPPSSMVQLRAAVAAKQVEMARYQGTATYLAAEANATGFSARQLQSNVLGDPVQPRLINLLGVNEAGALTNYSVSIFGYQPQPFITEVYVSTDTFSSVAAGTNPPGTNPRGYIAIELYNPYPFPITLTKDYDIARVDKSETNVTTGASSVYGVSCESIFSFGGQTIPANGYLVIDNRGDNAMSPNESTLPGGGAATYVPISAGSISGTVVSAPLQDLLGSTDNHNNGIGYEMVIRFKVDPDAGHTDFAHYQPIDSFDFNSIRIYDTGFRAGVYHYDRPCGTASNNNWRCVYPGRYNASPNKSLRQQGTDFAVFQPSSSDSNVNYDPWTDPKSNPPVIAYPTNHMAPTFGAANPYASWDVTQHRGTALIQLSEFGAPGPNPLSTANNAFPFGGFARDGDMLQVPYIGAYVITPSALKTSLIEMNSISMDACFAEDTDLTDDEQTASLMTAAVPHENIGRFCPIRDTMVADNRDDLNPAGTYLLANAAAATPGWNYRWATKLFDYLTVHANDADFMPNVQPAFATTYGGLPLAPQAVDNDGDGHANGKVPTGVSIVNDEQYFPNNGLINLNTAPARVLATLPFFTTGNNWTYMPGATGDAVGTWNAASSADQTDDNLKMAKQIVLWRDGDLQSATAAHGPFRTIYDLYRVPAFLAAQTAILDSANAPTHPAVANFAASGPDSTMGDFSPPPQAATMLAAPPGGLQDWARYDYEEQFLMMNRISNLVTTRSDSYIVYLLVQGWRNLGTAHPELAAQRRAAFIQDRWKIYPTNGTPNTAVPIPNN